MIQLVPLGFSYAMYLQSSTTRAHPHDSGDPANQSDVIFGSQEIFTFEEGWPTGSIDVAKFELFLLQINVAELTVKDNQFRQTIHKSGAGHGSFQQGDELTDPVLRR